MRIVILGFLRTRHGAVSFGGAEKSMIMLANSLVEFGHEVHLVSLSGNHVVYPISNNVCYYHFPEYEGNKIIKQLRIFFNTEKVIRKYNPEVIISFWLHPAIYAVHAAHKRKIKVIYSERNDPDLEYGMFIKKIRDLIIPQLDGFVFQSKGARKYFSEEIQRKSEIIHNPLYISYEAYPFVEKRDNRIVSVGRLTSQKNHKLLIIAFSQIADEFPTYNLEIYGEGSLEVELKLLIKEKKLENKVKLMGTTNKILDRIYGASLFVLPSIYEGMPNALMEAMALGIPCISSDCPAGGPKELICDGENGLLFTVEDVNDLVNKMRILLSDKERATKIGNRAKNICYSHSADKIFKLWNEYIQKVVKQ